MRIATLEVWGQIFGQDSKIKEITGCKEDLIKELLTLLPAKERSHAEVSKALDCAIWSNTLKWFANHSLGVKISQCH